MGEYKIQGGADVHVFQTANAGQRAILMTLLDIWLTAKTISMAKEHWV